MNNVARILIFLCVICSLPDTHGQDFELNTVLMESTFKLTAPGSTGTAFILGRPSVKDPKKSYYVLVTAAHVLEQSQGDKANLILRTKVKDDYIKAPYTVDIRSSGKQLWVKHPHADVAVMYVSLPEGILTSILPMQVLVNDEALKQFEIHPGDELLCLGYPLGAEGNEAGFPILRSGKIASYPLTPTTKVKKFLFDFNVFAGNSGGPVYFIQSSRTYAGAMRAGKIQFIAGLVTEQYEVEEEIKSLRETRKQKHPLGLGVVVHASLIEEAINALPPKDN